MGNVQQNEYENMLCSCDQRFDRACGHFCHRPV